MSPLDSAVLTLAVILFPLLIAFTARTWVLRTVARQPERKAELGSRYSNFRGRMYFVHLMAVALAIAGLGWGSTVWNHLRIDWRGERLLAPFAELSVSLPYFLIIMGCWLIHYDAERALTFRSGSRAFWSRTSYFTHQLRQILIVCLPMGMLATQQTIRRYFPDFADSDPFRLGSLLLFPPMVLILPRILKRFLGLQSLPDGPRRERLEALAKRLHFRYADILVWPTHGLVVNAMLVGLMARFRYVIFTDRLLDEFQPGEIDAVFGHEVGHARHGHPIYYMLFLISSLAAFLAIGLYLDTLFDPSIATDEGLEDWLMLATYLIMAIYFFLVFGWISRCCERQADIYGCRVGSCGDPKCTGHDDTTIYPEKGTSLCPTGIRSCVLALEHVGLLVGQERPTRQSLSGFFLEFLAWFRSWQHGTLPRRVDYLLTLVNDPGRASRFERRLFFWRCAVLLALATIVILLGSVVGWRELLAVM